MSGLPHGAHDLAHKTLLFACGPSAITNAARTDPQAIVRLFHHELEAMLYAMARRTLICVAFREKRRRPNSRDAL